MINFDTTSESLSQFTNLHYGKKAKSINSKNDSIIDFHNSICVINNVQDPVTRRPTSRPLSMAFITSGFTLGLLRTSSNSDTLIIGTWRINKVQKAKKIYKPERRVNQKVVTVGPQEITFKNTKFINTVIQKTQTLPTHLFQSIIKYLQPREAVDFLIDHKYRSRHGETNLPPSRITWLDRTIDELVFDNLSQTLLEYYSVLKRDNHSSGTHHCLHIQSQLYQIEGQQKTFTFPNLGMGTVGSRFFNIIAEATRLSTSTDRYGRLNPDKYNYCDRSSLKLSDCKGKTVFKAIFQEENIGYDYQDNIRRTIIIKDQDPIVVTNYD